jgi:hypothetical protein
VCLVTTSVPLSVINVEWKSLSMFMSRSVIRRLVAGSGKRWRADEEAVDWTEEVRYSRVLFVRWV